MFPKQLLASLARRTMHHLAEKNELEPAIAVILHAWIRYVYKPNVLVAGADVSDSDTELF